MMFSWGRCGICGRVGNFGGLGNGNCQLAVVDVENGREWERDLAMFLSQRRMRVMYLFVEVKGAHKRQKVIQEDSMVYIKL